MVKVSGVVMPTNAITRPPMVKYLTSGITRLPSGRLTQLLERYGKSASAIASFARAMP